MSGEHLGILNVRKEGGWTSHDVVARVRRLAGQKRVGHAGTLDPLAEGVLPVLLGRATRLADLVQAGRKGYRAHVRLGTATTTDDAEGEVLEAAAVPTLDPRELDAALRRFEGEILQVPPAYSAIKVGGRRAYAIARGGGSPDLAARPVRIDEVRLVEQTADTLVLDITCSRGTYIRALARDLARELGTVGHLASLVRTRVGPFRVEEALTLGDIEARGVAAALLPPEAALPDTPAFLASEQHARWLSDGRGVPAPDLEAPLVRVYDARGMMRWVGTAEGGMLRARITLAPLADETAGAAA